MNDLISRQAFLDFIESVPFLLEHQNFKGIVIDWIKQQPTACNPDKVVDEFVKIYKSKTSMENKLIDEIAEQLKGGGISE